MQTFCHAPSPPEVYTLSLHDALPICTQAGSGKATVQPRSTCRAATLFSPSSRETCSRDSESTPSRTNASKRSEEHTSELQSPDHLVCRLLLEKKNRHIGTSSRSSRYD